MLKLLSLCHQKTQVKLLDPLKTAICSLNFYAFWNPFADFAVCTELLLVSMAAPEGYSTFQGLPFVCAMNTFIVTTFFHLILYSSPNNICFITFMTIVVDIRRKAQRLFTNALSYHCAAAGKRSMTN